MQPHSDTLLIVTHGAGDGGVRATLAFAWACAALDAGDTVTVYLAGEGVRWASRLHTRAISAAGFAPLDSYVEKFLASGGELLVCGPCVTEELPSPLWPSAETVDLPAVVDRAGPVSKVVTF